MMIVNANDHPYKPVVLMAFRSNVDIMKLNNGDTCVYQALS